MIVTAQDVVDFLGRDYVETESDKMAAHISASTHMVRGYTRGRGFDPGGEPDDALAAVIVSCTARQVSNPSHTVASAIEDASFRQGMFTGWTLPELAILNNYRVRAR